jgi:hypothetical protein
MNFMIDERFHDIIDGIAPPHHSSSKMPFTLNSALSQATRYGTRWSKLFSKQYATYLKPHQHHVQPLIDFTASGWQQARDFASPYLALVTPYVESATQDVRTTINEFFEEQEAVRVVATTVMLTLLSLIALSIVIEVLDFCFSQIGKLMGWGALFSRSVLTSEFNRA